ncbi:MAG: DUF4445 domain-containing protein [Deltaproteobacteria bacterium]|nr:DUF4445 domain-containing protein [Deltaproteobacteria bacterium]
MADIIRIQLQPSGESVDVERGTALRDVLYAFGVEFPCGGTGSCGHCRVEVLEGELPASDDEAWLLSEQELRAGWRLACRARVDGPLTLKVEQHATPILADQSELSFEPQRGFGVAVDIGTTTLVAQLIDLESGRVMASQTALNPQGTHGSDVMTRLQYALDETARRELSSLIRTAVGRLVTDSMSTANLRAGAVNRVVCVGNTVMHHLFSELEPHALTRVPFESSNTGLQQFSAAELGWNIGKDVAVRFLPCLGGFVGSDILAGMLATRIHEDRALSVLVDLGTNGEIVIGNSERLLCASTAAGPAFEAGGIRQGMRATRGAIDQVRIDSNEFHCHVVGGGEARGICGSGLVDAVACGLESGRIEASGRLCDGRKSFGLTGSVELAQADIRQLQLAKAAIAAGIRILLERLGKSERDVRRLFLAGAFGNYVDRRSARRIGLIPETSQNSDAVGNTALRGAKLALFCGESSDWRFADLRSRVEHVSLATSAEFQETFIEQTRFPDESPG